jgi:uncharacterized cysteine cluster protein YcgN (CxxCxxCC family)
MLVRIRRAMRGRRERWDAICDRCGLCCYQKQIRRGAVITDWRSPCRFLDESTRLCTVYEDRFAACPDCRRMTLTHAFFTSWLPENCAYVRRYRRPILAVFRPLFVRVPAGTRDSHAGKAWERR